MSWALRSIVDLCLVVREGGGGGGGGGEVATVYSPLIIYTIVTLELDASIQLSL